MPFRHSWPAGRCAWAGRACRKAANLRQQLTVRDRRRRAHQAEWAGVPASVFSVFANFVRRVAPRGGWTVAAATLGCRCAGADSVNCSQASDCWCRRSQWRCSRGRGRGACAEGPQSQRFAQLLAHISRHCGTFDKALCMHHESSLWCDVIGVRVYPRVQSFAHRPKCSQDSSCCCSNCKRLEFAYPLHRRPVGLLLHPHDQAPSR